MQREVELFPQQRNISPVRNAVNNGDAGQHVEQIELDEEQQVQALRQEIADYKQLVRCQRERQQLEQDLVRQIEEERQRAEVLRQQAQEYQNRLRAQQHPQPLGETERMYKRMKFETDKFENLKKKIGPFTSALNSQTWITRLEADLETLRSSYAYFMGSMRFFFTPTDDEIVKTWYENKEAVLVPRIRETGEDEEALSYIWEEFKAEFLDQFDPKVRARAAEDEYDCFKWQEDMSSTQFVSKLQTLFLKVDPRMPTDELVRRMYRKLPIDTQKDITDEYLSSVPKFTLRLETLIKCMPDKFNGMKKNEDKPEQTTKEVTATDEVSTAKEAEKPAETQSDSDDPALKKIQQKTIVCYYCNKPGHVKRDCYKRRYDEGWEDHGEDCDEYEDEYWEEEGDYNQNYGHGRKRA